MTTAAELRRFTGIAYDLRHMDCADHVLLVQREHFGVERMLPGRRPRPLRPDAQAEAIHLAVGELAIRIESPQDGDLVLMHEGDQAHPGHAGTYFFLDHQSWVLHCSNTIGSSRLHRLRDLTGLGLQVEGFYRWK